MQYMITWNERQQGSPIEYENAQKRILEVFSPWSSPANFKIQSFVIRVGDFAELKPVNDRIGPELDPAGIFADSTNLAGISGLIALFGWRISEDALIEIRRQ